MLIVDDEDDDNDDDDDADDDKLFMQNRWKMKCVKLSFISSHDCCQSFSSSYTTTAQERFKPAQSLSSGFVESSSAVAITTEQKNEVFH